MLERVLTAYHDGELDDCIRRVRTLVEAAPLATAPRQLLASLYAETGKARLALVHYRKLLPQAIARGQLFRSIAIQKQIDSFRSSGTPDPQRWASLLTQIRSRGLPHLAAPAGAGRPWVEAQMLALPRVWFSRLIEETRVEMLGRGAEPEEVEAGTVWEVLAGRARWSFQLPDGRASTESPAAEGDAIHVDPELAPRARVTFLVELPVECLRFEASLTRELQRERAASQPLTGATAGGFTPDARALLPTRLRRREDLDVAPSVPTSAQGEAPPRLAPPAEGAAPADAPHDTGEWVEHGVVSLSGSPADSGGDASAPEAVPGTTVDLTPDAARAAGASDPTDPPRERTIELPPLGEKPARRRGRPVVERPGPQEMGDGLIVPPTPDPFAAPIPDLGKPIERRRHPRVAASFQTRMAMLRLPGTRVAPIHGELFDLSTRGLGLRFSKELAVTGGALADAVVAVELDMPGPEGSLRMAAQVRWLEIDEDRTEARIGIEFVLMTEPDRRRIEAALASVPQPARDAAAEAP
jgi:hypothetical protein